MLGLNSTKMRTRYKVGPSNGGKGDSQNSDCKSKHQLKKCNDNDGDYSDDGLRWETLSKFEVDQHSSISSFTSNSSSTRIPLRCRPSHAVVEQKQKHLLIAGREREFHHHLMSGSSLLSIPLCHSETRLPCPPSHHNPDVTVRQSLLSASLSSSDGMSSRASVTRVMGVKAINSTGTQQDRDAFQMPSIDQRGTIAEQSRGSIMDRDPPTDKVVSSAIRRRSIVVSTKKSVINAEDNRRYEQLKEAVEPTLISDDTRLACHESTDLSSQNSLKLCHELPDSFQTRNCLDTDGQSSISPAQQSISPAQHSIFPAQQSIFPAQQSIFPAQHSVSPAQHSISPAQQSISPTQQSISPAQHSVSSAQHSISPAQHSIFPAQQSESVSPIHDQQARMTNSQVPKQEVTDGQSNPMLDDDTLYDRVTSASTPKWSPAQHRCSPRQSARGGIVTTDELPKCLLSPVERCHSPQIVIEAVQHTPADAACMRTGQQAQILDARHISGGYSKPSSPLMNPFNDPTNPKVFHHLTALKTTQVEVKSNAPTSRFLTLRLCLIPLPVLLILLWVFPLLFDCLLEPRVVDQIIA